MDHKVSAIISQNSIVSNGQSAADRPVSNVASGARMLSGSNLFNMMRPSLERSALVGGKNRSD